MVVGYEMLNCEGLIFFFVSIYNNLWCIESVVFIIKDKAAINNWGYSRKSLCRVAFNFN